ncbi:hypothetical protein [Malonomonas rubra]|uniref:hypothetical protein n=1 Tax=Malonomonas rubra TaxID=57040 RepID=UPI0026EFE164|nr:hypothetical protein [Malonomonas rubra]
MSRSRVLLLLILLLVAAIWYEWQEPPHQQKVVSEKSLPERNDGVISAKNGPAGFVALDFSGGDKLGFKPPRRDLFRSLYRVPAATPVPEAKPIPKPVEVAPPPPPPAPPPPPPPPPPPTGLKPIQPLIVLGFLQKGVQTTVFLSSRQGEIFLVKKGDRFADGLLVRELFGDKVVISRGMDDPGVTLTVEEHKNLRVGIKSAPSGRPNVPSNVPDIEAPASNSSQPQEGAGEN